jgi:hypothetical protein
MKSPPSTVMLKQMATVCWSTRSSDTPTRDRRRGGGELRAFLGWFVTGRLSPDMPVRPAAEVRPPVATVES